MLGFKVALSEAEKIRFRLSLPSYGRQYADIILRVAEEEKVPPAVIAGLLSRETDFGRSSGLDVKGPGGRGDNGHGHGLMQIDDRSWGDWLKANRWQDPYVNIKQGTRILKGKLAFLSAKGKGTIKIGGKQYPDVRPLSGDALYAAGIAAYNTGEGNVIRNLAQGKPAEVSTHGGDYATDVVKRARRYV